MWRMTRILAVMLLLAVTAACNLTRATLVPTSQPTQATVAPTLPFGTINPSITPFDLSSPTPDGRGGGTCTPPLGWIAYVVQAGDSLGALAEATGTTTDALAAANCITNANNLIVGQTIYLPSDPVVG